MSEGPFFDVGMHAADGNVNWDSWLYNGVMGGGLYAYGSFSTSVLLANKQYPSRWWWRDFPEGLWEWKVIHVTGFDVGIYSFRIDDREVGRLDGYSLVDVNNIETVVAKRIPIRKGLHKISVELRDTNPSAVAAGGAPAEAKFYPAIQGMLFRRTGPAKNRASFASPCGAIQQRHGQVITLIPLFATGNTNWNSLQYTANMANAYELFSSGAQNASRWWDLDLAAGQYDLDLLVATFASAGIISVQIDGTTQALIDTYSSSTAYGVRKTARISVNTSGTHRLALTMATKNASSSSYFGDLSNLQLRRVGAGGMPPRIVNFATYWASGNTNWSTLTPLGIEYGGDVESSGSQNDARWWYVELQKGTWDFEMLHRTGSNRGVYHVLIDDVEVGTIDGFGGTATARSSVTGFSVAWSGTHKLSLVMASKNGSSSAYYGTVGAIQLRRTT